MADEDSLGLDPDRAQALAALLSPKTPADSRRAATALLRQIAAPVRPDSAEGF